MAEYGVKYRFRWNDEGGGDWRIDICQAGYTGDILPRAIGASSVSLRRDRNGNICGTSLELTAECRVDEEFAELYTTDPFEFKVLVYAENVCIWTGYVTPELYSEPFIAPPYDVKVTASDNLGELKLTEWVGVGRLTFAQLLNTLLAQTGLSMGVKYISTLATGSINAQAFFSTVTIDLDELSGKSYYDVLDQLLASFHAVLFQHGGSWVVLRETDVVPSISGGAVVPVGQSAGMPIRTLGSAYAGGLWPENHVDLTVEPAKKAISLVCSELWNRCGTASITNPSTGNATGTMTATFAAADGINLNDSSTTSRYPLVLNIEALRKNRSNKVYYDIVVKVQGNGVTRYLVENTDAAEGYAWQSSSASIRITPGDKLYYAGRGDVSASKSGEVTSIPFPNCDDITALTKIEVTLTSNTIATSYRPTRYLPSVYFFGVWISYDDQFTSLMDTIAINNNARGAASDVNLIVSGLTDTALEKYFISNSLLDGSGSLLGAVHTSAFEGQDYISLLSRDYALSIAAPRLKAEGVFYGQERTDLPLFMSMGGLRYVIETWDWNLITGGVDFSALTLPAATITVTSETIVTGDNLGHGSSSGSGGSGGASSSGAGYVAPGTGVPALTEAYIGTTRVQPSPTEDQDLTGIGNATLSGKLNLPQGAYLEVVNVGTTANPVYAIHTNIGLYSDSFISAFGASGGGGGGGGIDLSAMWANLQVNESGTTGYNLQINPGHLTTALGTYVNAITTTGSGNAITAVSKDGSTLTFTKGSTFALASRTVTGTGYLTGGGALSANRTIDIASTYKGYIDEGHTAYGWGDHSQAGYLTSHQSLANYVTLNSAQTITALKTSRFNSQVLLGLTRTGGNYAAIEFAGTVSSVEDTALGRIGYSPDGAWVRDASDTTYRYIWHSGNLTSSAITDILASGSIANGKLANSSITINGTSTSLGGTFNTASITAGTAGTSSATSGLSFAVPYVTLNAYGVATAYGTHTHTISKANITTAIGSTTYAPYNADGYLPLSGGTLTGDLTAPKFIKTGGTSSQFLKADGSVDSSAYLTTATAANTYLPLSGGTMSGNIVFSKSGNITVGFPILALSSITVGWSRKLYEMRYDDTLMFHIGAFGSASTFNYAYLGSNGYNGDNLRIYSDKVQFGDNVIWHAGNANLSTVNWVCKLLTANSGMIAGGSTSGAYLGSASGGLGSTYTGGLILAYGNNPLYFYTNSGNRMMITGGGNVGIGTTSPANRLHVSGAGRFDSNANIWSTISGALINFNKLSTYTTGYNQGIRFRIADSSDTEISSKYLLGVYSGSSYGYMYLGGTYTDAPVRITDTGVGIMKGNASPSYALDVGGSMRVTGATTLANLTVGSSNSITLGDGVLTWDSNAQAWKLTGNLYATGFISAFGASDTGGSGGGGINLAAMWANLQVNDSDTTGYGLQIHPGHLTDALGTYVNAIATTGSGTVVTGITKSGHTLTVNYGSGSAAGGLSIIDLDDNGTTTAGTWLASSSAISAYTDGLMVRYKLTKAGAATTTLNINGLGAKTVYRFNSTKLTTHYSVGSYLILIYNASLNSGCWITVDGYDSNTNTYVRQYVASDNNEYALLARYATASVSSYQDNYARFANAVTLNPSKGSLSATQFYQNGNRVPNITVSSSAPSASDGEVGDVWIQV